MVTVALAHDYFTQCGGAERVVEVMAGAFPGAPIHTSLYHPSGTYPGLARLDIRPSSLNRLGVLRRNHRLALPVLAPTMSRTTIDADVLLASSSGWAHGLHTTGRKVVYCHAPARWLYQTQRYVSGPTDRPVSSSLLHRSRQVAGAVAIMALGEPLRRWDQRAARAADRYLVNSTMVAEAVWDAYGIESEVLPPPPALTPGLERPYSGVEPGYFLCVARLLPYKNIDVVIEATSLLPDARLVVVGSGPDRDRLRRLADSRKVTFVGRVDDDQLRWLYRNTKGLVSASFEDYGLTPLEAASFGRPAAVLRAGGFLDTVVEGRTGVFFGEPEPAQVAKALSVLDDGDWDEGMMTSHAAAFSATKFADRLQAVVGEVVAA
jgi:glycosyltransferase involved in cell wall biosynthesis